MRKAAYALAGIVAVLALGAWLAFISIDVIVKWTLEHYGADVTGTPVRVAHVAISPRDGRGSIGGLEVGNPSGFSAANALRVGEIRVALEPATLTHDVVHLTELVVDAPQVTYERGAKVTNLDVIQEHIEAYVKRMQAADGGATAAESKPRQARRRFIVDRLVIRGARVTMTTAGLRGQGLGFDLPDVELSEVGRRRGGLTASELAQVVASALQQRIAQKLLTNLDLLRRGGVEGALDALKGLLR